MPLPCHRPGVNYADWASTEDNTVYTGDVLVFNYPAYSDEVYLFSDPVAFQRCQFWKATKVCSDTDGEAGCTVRIDTPGVALFASGMIARCTWNSKLNVTVIQRGTPRNVYVGKIMPGYTYPWNPAVNYTDWAATTTVYIGDSLVFKYPDGLDEVYKVPTQADYDACEVRNYETILPPVLTQSPFFSPLPRVASSNSAAMAGVPSAQLSPRSASGPPHPVREAERISPSAISLDIENPRSFPTNAGKAATDGATCAYSGSGGEAGPSAKAAAPPAFSSAAADIYRDEAGVGGTEILPAEAGARGTAGGGASSGAEAGAAGGKGNGELNGESNPPLDDDVEDDLSLLTLQRPPPTTRSARLKRICGRLLSAVASPITGIAAWMRDLGRVFGWPLLGVVMVAYGINQGYGSSLMGLSLSYYWKDVQHLQPAAAQFYMSFVGIPWDVKPLYGMITDTFPILGFQRWPYIALSGIIGTAAWWALGVLPALVPAVATALLVVQALSCAVPDVVVDGMVAQEIRLHPSYAADLQVRKGLHTNSGAAAGAVRKGRGGEERSVRVVLLVVQALSCAVPDVVVDGMVAQEIRLHPSYAADLQMAEWGSQKGREEAVRAKRALVGAPVPTPVPPRVIRHSSVLQSLPPASLARTLSRPHPLSPAPSLARTLSHPRLSPLLYQQLLSHQIPRSPMQRLRPHLPSPLLLPQFTSPAPIPPVPPSSLSRARLAPLLHHQRLSHQTPRSPFAPSSSSPISTPFLSLHPFPSPPPPHQSLPAACLALASLLSYTISGSLIKSLGPCGTFFLISLAPFSLIVAALLLPETRLPEGKRKGDVKKLRTTWRRFIGTIRHRKIARAALFIFIAQVRGAELGCEVVCVCVV
ncbi:unnamed protein product [Closterium sp. Yama58-4]|nr:unnamed protein product [Closterium sp. Yama58-4]